MLDQTLEHTYLSYLKGLSFVALMWVCHYFQINIQNGLLDFSLIFSDKWSPALQIRTVLLSIQALLSAPNPDDPLANDVAELWKVNEAEAIRNAKEWTRLYAMGN